MRLFVSALAAVMLLQALPAEAAELVVSTTDISVQVSGPWQTASASDDGQPYLFRPAGAGGATVYWPFPTTLGAGQYQVFARWVSGPDRTNNATYYVASSDGTQPITENQQQNGGNWQSLGTFTFTPGTGQGVTLTDSASGIVVAGAVRYTTADAAPQATAQATPQATSQAAPQATAPATPQATSQPTAQPTLSDANWTVTLGPTDLHAGPDAS